MSEWKTVKLAELAKGVRGVSYKPYHLKDALDAESVVLLRSNNIQRTLVFTDIQIVPRNIVEETQILRKNDVVVCMSNGSKALVGKSSLFSQDQSVPYTIGAFCSLFRPIQDSDSFVYHLFQSDRYQKQVDTSIAGSAINNLNNGEIEKYTFDVPCALVEQRKIARILSTVDSVIERTEAAIAKYTAIKQGMMHDLFTRGIDLKTGKLRPKYEDAPELYKKTELGMVPKEWEVDVLGNLEYFELATGGTPSTSIKEYWNGDIKWMASGEVNKKRIFEVDGRITQEGYEHSNARLYPINTVVIGLAGQGKTRGTVAITFVETTSNQSIAGIICSEKYNSFFLYHLLDFQYEELRSASAGAGRAGLSLSILSKYNIIMPKKIEQDYIAIKLETIDTNITNENNTMNKYQKLKLALMSVLLTGRKRVKYTEETTEAS